MLQTTKIIMISAALSVIVHSAECGNRECQSEVNRSRGAAVVGSSFIQATGTTVKMSRISSTVDPFEDLEDSFDIPTVGRPSFASARKPAGGQPEDLEDSFDIPTVDRPSSPSGHTPSTSGVTLLNKSEFWLRCVQDVVIFTALFMLIPLAFGALFEARSRMVTREPQAENIALGRTNQRAFVNLLPLMEAARAGDEPRWRLLLEAPRLARAEDRFGSTALHVAASAPCVEMATALVNECCVDVNAKDTWEETPLHFAARAGSVDICELLLEHGADLDTLNADGSTPLLAAAKAGKEATCHLLLDKGASCGGVTDLELPPLLTSLLLHKLATSTTPRHEADAENEAAS